MAVRVCRTDRASGPCSAISAYRELALTTATSPPRFRACARDPLVVLHDVAGVDDEQVVVVRQPIDQHVVDERAGGRGQRGVLRLADRQLATRRCWSATGRPRARPAPAISISPMWLTSNSPARVRTARCSSVMPEYSTGMSQPANSTIRPPLARCRALSGVFLIAGWLDDMGESAEWRSRHIGKRYNVSRGRWTVKDSAAAHSASAGWRPHAASRESLASTKS